MQDYGGPVGFRLALKNPGRVQRLINHGRTLGARFAIENIQPVHLNGLIANLDRRPLSPAEPGALPPPPSWAATSK